MVTADMEMRIALIHELEAQKSELEAQIEALKDGVKAEMDAHRVSSMEVGGFSVHWTRYFQQRFDTKTCMWSTRSRYRRAGSR